TLMARITSGCWGTRGFDSWDFCSDTPVAFGKKALSTIAGPLVNFILLWNGWQLMDERNFANQQSLGVSLVFAALPLNNLLGAFSGGGDLTNTLRLLLTRVNAHNHRALTIAGLLIMLIICVPPLIRAFICLPWGQGKFLYYPLFLIVPGFLDRWLVGGLLNKWLIHPDTPQSVAYMWVGAWTALTFAVWMLTRKHITWLINEDRLPL
ncbi:MAG: hypothetical protein JST68_22845, partial [Bacteroidetes bacterium]|nr:hypothetical protein [Bacteroidota bacterium]